MQAEEAARARESFAATRVEVRVEEQFRSEMVEEASLRGREP